MVKYRFVAGVQGRRARQKQRKGIKLRDAGVTVQTQERYYVAVREVLKFFDKSISFPQVDELIADWIEKKFESGYPLNGVADCLSGIHALATCCDSVLVCRGSNASLFCFISLGLVLLSVVTIPTGVLVGCMLIPVCTGSHSGVVPVYRFAEEGSLARLWFWKLLVPLKS